jgi:hypothetical protein
MKELESTLDGGVRFGWDFVPSSLVAASLIVDGCLIHLRLSGKRDEKQAGRGILEIRIYV